MRKQINSVLITLVFLQFVSTVKAQSLYPSAVTIETLLNKKTINAKNLSSLVQVNEGTSQIVLKIDARDITTGNDSLDLLLKSLTNPIIIFKGNFPIKNLSFVDNNNEEQREFSEKGQLTINGITLEQNYTCVVLNLNGNDMFSANNMAYPLNINLYFEFEPEDFKLHTLYQPFVNGVKVEISKGLINKLTASSQSLFNKN